MLPAILERIKPAYPHLVHYSKPGDIIMYGPPDPPDIVTDAQSDLPRNEIALCDDEVVIQDIRNAVARGCNDD